MKQYITLEQLNELSEYQKSALNDIWVPEKYDLAVASICKDAENEEYDQIEFVIGDIEFYQTTGGSFCSIVLWNLKSMDSEEQQDLADESTYTEENYNNEYFEPVSYGKEDCLPLLNIGQMIKILRELSFGEGKFFLDIQNNKDKCGIGRDIFLYKDYGNESEGKELCDILWGVIKEIL